MSGILGGVNVPVPDEESVNCPLNTLASVLNDAPESGGGPHWDKEEALKAVAELRDIAAALRDGVDAA
ncbi:hypothetical protein QZH56_35720 [Streptomyces olivoreticuli]|uniref:hypothetical protein n=1 Tax=Streptomyces olivoreticuli TaxID=68246 RepID=UPI002658AC86|nr:hypothetical protein [Streptomyces olivoreticuli]WKK23971.1 hypothetical protein QZH56_35720 [Streptomyces olivoreticuli]